MKKATQCCFYNWSWYNRNTCKIIIEKLQTIQIEIELVAHSSYGTDNRNVFQNWNNTESRSTLFVHTHLYILSSRSMLFVFQELSLGHTPVYNTCYRQGKRCLLLLHMFAHLSTYCRLGHCCSFIRCCCVSTHLSTCGGYVLCCLMSRCSCLCTRLSTRVRHRPCCLFRCSWMSTHLSTCCCQCPKPWCWHPPGTCMSACLASVCWAGLQNGLCAMQRPRNIWSGAPIFAHSWLSIPPPSALSSCIFTRSVVMLSRIYMFDSMGDWMLLVRFEELWFLIINFIIYLI